MFGSSHLGLDDDARRTLRLAALVHDLGRIAVGNAVWDKPGPFTASEWEDVRGHAFETDRVVGAMGGPFGRAASLASAAHERLDGTGYHRRLGGGALDPMARILAVADVAQALSEPRPHRPARTPAEARDLLAGLSASRSLCAKAVDAVLGDDAVPRPRATYPRGLTQREIEVLRLVARGLTDKEIAGRLGLSPRTVHHHNQHAYGKLGVSTRAAAALFLVEEDLLDD